MPEHLNLEQYRIPQELMEPQAPITTHEGYHIVGRDEIEDPGILSIPAELNPVYLKAETASETREKVIKGGAGSEFRDAQENAYAEREMRRTYILDKLSRLATSGLVEPPATETTYTRLLDPSESFESLPVEGAAVRDEPSEEQRMQNAREQADMSSWNDNIAKHNRGNQ